MSNISNDLFAKAIGTLLNEAYHRSADSRGTWFVDNEPDSGFLGTVEGITFAEATHQVPGADGGTIAAHTAHLSYALSLANRAYKGENPFAAADWDASWDTGDLDEPGWRKLLSGLRQEFEQLEKNLETMTDWSNDFLFTGTIAIIAHGAWHLGAVRQMLNFARSTA